MHPSSFQQSLSSHPPNNASFIGAAPIPEQYPPSMSAHSVRPPPLNMNQVYHSNNSNRASMISSSHYSSSSSIHDSQRSRRISVVTSSDWKVSSGRPSSRMEKTCSDSIIEHRQSTCASIIEPPMTPAYTPKPSSSSYHQHGNNSYFPSQQQQQQHQMVASPQDYRMMTSPIPTPGSNNSNQQQQQQPFVGGFVVPPPIVQQPRYPPHVQPPPSQLPQQPHHYPHHPPRPSPALPQRRQSSFVESLPPPPSSSSASLSSYSHRRSMPPPSVTKTPSSGAQTLPNRVGSITEMNTTAAKPAPSPPAATQQQPQQQQQPAPPSNKQKKNIGLFANKEKRQITVQSINEEHRVWIDIAPNETGASLAHKIHVIATFRTKKILSITTASGRKVPLNRRRLFDGWAELENFEDGERWEVEWGDLDKSIVDRLLSKVVQTSEAS